MAESRVATEIDKIIDDKVAQIEKLALSESSPFWDGIIGFVGWLRAPLKIFLVLKLQKLPIIGKMAELIGSTVVDIGYAILESLLNFMKIVFSSSDVWKKAHDSACLAWNANEDNGLLVQTYAYSKKLAEYYLEIIKQCLERAIAAHGFKISQELKAELAHGWTAVNYC